MIANIWTDPWTTPNLMQTPLQELVASFEVLLVFGVCYLIFWAIARR